MNPDLADLGIYFNVKSSTAVAISRGNENLLKLINGIIDENQDNIQSWIKEYSEKAIASAKK